MGQLIIVEGKTGTGKTTSWRNMPPAQTVIFTPNTKSLPFPRSKKNYVLGQNMFYIEDMAQLDMFVLQANKCMPNIKYFMVDDFTHFITKRTLSQAFKNDKGFDKWAQLGCDIMTKLVNLASKLPQGTFLCINSHTEINNEGFHAFATTGKLMGDKIQVPSWATYVFHARQVVDPATDRPQYMFQTNLDATYEAKSPIDWDEVDENGQPKPLFDFLVPNDLYPLLAKIEAYESRDEEQTQQAQ